MTPRDYSVAYSRENDRVELAALEPGSGRPVAMLSLSNQDACQLAAWLVWAAGDSQHMNAEEAIAYFQRSFVDASSFDRGGS